MDPVLLHWDKSGCRFPFESLVEELTQEPPPLAIRHKDMLKSIPNLVGVMRCVLSRRKRQLTTRW